MTLGIYPTLLRGLRTSVLHFDVTISGPADQSEWNGLNQDEKEGNRDPGKINDSRHLRHQTILDLCRRYIDGTRKRINSRVLLPCADILCDGVRGDAGTAPDHLAQKRALGGEMFAGLVGIDGSHHGPGLVAVGG